MGFEFILFLDNFSWPNDGDMEGRCVLARDIHQTIVGAGYDQETATKYSVGRLFSGISQVLLKFDGLVLVEQSDVVG